MRPAGTGPRLTRITFAEPRKVLPILRTDEPVCPEGKLSCGNGECVDKELFCNGKPDCKDESDENACSKYSATISPCTCAASLEYYFHYHLARAGQPRYITERSGGKLILHQGNGWNAYAASYSTAAMRTVSISYGAINYSIDF